MASGCPSSAARWNICKASGRFPHNGRWPTTPVEPEATARSPSSSPFAPKRPPPAGGEQ
ncbi:unnamed protein product [Ectocarpus sp. CCAP 1310/34]|nr:unnamed protein product [Ectocarpus sp. CCAP 1310/34]